MVGLCTRELVALITEKIGRILGRYIFFFYMVGLRSIPNSVPYSLGI